MVQVEVYTTSNKKIGDISIPETAKIKDIKKEIARISKLSVDRQSVRADTKGKDIKDDSTIENLNDTRKVFVKDLGPQIGWNTVFLLEYAGPFVIYGLVALRPWLLYGSEAAGTQLSTTAKIALGCWSAHYLKRILETLFVHRFSHGTMPIRNLFKNCGYYWGFCLYVAYHVNHPLFTPPSLLQQTVGLILFVVRQKDRVSGSQCTEYIATLLKARPMHLNVVPEKKLALKTLTAELKVSTMVLNAAHIAGVGYKATLLKARPMHLNVVPEKKLALNTLTAELKVSTMVLNAAHIAGVCEVGNLSTHILLRNLRPPGSTIRKIPMPNSFPLTKLFDFVSCPNYTYEVGAWIGFTIMTSCLPAGLFTFAGFYQMAVWALGKHRNYRKEFPNYPKQRKAIVPFIL